MRMQDSNRPEYSGTSELENIEQNLPNYNLRLVRLFLHNMRPKQESADFHFVDFGAGIGTLAQLFLTEYGLRPAVIEIDPSLLERLQNLGFQTYQSANEIPKESYAACYSSNVLEHIPDDQASLCDIHKILKPGGRLVIYVPAFEVLWSPMDDQVGHLRRYRKMKLKKLVTSSGFRVLSCDYSDSVGFFTSLFLRLFQNQKRFGVNNKHSLAFYDKFIYPISIFLDGLGLRYFFGKNLLLVAEKI